MVDKVNPISGAGAMTGKMQARVNPDGPSFRDHMRGNIGEDEDAAWLPGTLYEAVLASDEHERRHILIGERDLDLLIEPVCQNGRVVLRIDAYQNKMIEASILVIDGHPLDPAERILMQLRHGPRQAKDILDAGQDLAASFAEPEMAHIGGDMLGQRFIAKIIDLARPGDDLAPKPAPAGWQLVTGRTMGRERGRLVVESTIGRLLLESPARPAPESPVLLALPDSSRLQHHEPVFALPSRSSLSQNMDTYRQQQILHQDRHDSDASVSPTNPAPDMQANWGIQQSPAITGFGDPPTVPTPDPAQKIPPNALTGARLDMGQQILAQSVDTDMPVVEQPEYSFDDEIGDADTMSPGPQQLITEFEDNSSARTITESDPDMVAPVSQNPASPQPAAPATGTAGNNSTANPVSGNAVSGNASTSGSAPANTAPPAPPAQPVTVTAGAAGLSGGQQINALVTGSTANGQVLLQSGGVTLQNQAVLPKELLQATNFQLAITASKGDLVQAEILSMDGKPLPGNKSISLVFTRFTGPPSLVNPGQTGQSGTATTLPGGQNATPQPGQLLTGLLANPATGSGLTTGSQLQFRITGITLPGTGPTAMPAPASTASGQATAGTTTSPAPGTANTATIPGNTGNSPAAAFPAGSAAAARGQPPAPGAQSATPGAAGTQNIPGQQGGQPPVIPGQAAANPVAGQSITATVAARTASGILLETSLGTVTLQGNPDLPVGSKLTLQLQGLQKPYAGDAQRMAVMGTDNRMAALDSLMEEWPALKETLSLLQATSPQAAQSLMSRMPAMNARLTANILFFMNALGTNNVARFTGQAALDVLRQAGQGDIAERLSGDFSQMGRLSSETGNSDWRAFVMPFYDGQNLQQVQFFLDQRNKAKDKQNSEDDPTHFVMNLSFSELGPMQLDGMVDPVKDNPLTRFNFDMTMRSRYKLADEVMQHIGSIFYAGLDVGGLTGNLSFRVVEQFPEDPLGDLRTNKDSDIIV